MDAWRDGFWFYGLMAMTQDFESWDQGSIPCRTFGVGGEFGKTTCPSG